MRFIGFAFLAANVYLAAIGVAIAQSFPNRPITVVVPHGAGGFTDTVARIVSLSMQSDLGQAVVIENRVGGGGAAAATHLQKASADGYTLLLWASSFDALRSMRAVPVATVAVKGNDLYGIVAPIGTPQTVVDRVNSAINKAVTASDVKSRLAGLGMEAKASTAKEAADLIRTGP